MTDTPSAWPNGAAGAVSVSFDDGPPTSLDIVVPMLNTRGFHGTFYLPMGDDGPFYLREAEWCEAARSGHEIGNHSMTHPCSQNLGFGPADLDDLSLDDIEAQVVEAKRRIDEALPDQTEHSYAYPCGETHVGRGLTRASYVPVVAKHYLVGRWLGDGVTSNYPAGVDLACVWAPMPVGESGESLIAVAEAAADAGKWAVYAFHGIGGDHHSNSAEDFGALVDHLAANRDRIWVDTVTTVGRWIHEHR